MKIFFLIADKFFCTNMKRKRNIGGLFKRICTSVENFRDKTNQLAAPNKCAVSIMFFGNNAYTNY